MLLSHNHRFIFVHIWRTGGTSISEALRQHADPQWCVLRARRSAKVDEPSGSAVRHSLWRRLFGRSLPAARGPEYLSRHSTAREVRMRVAPEVFESYFKFAFVRNPFELLVSWYHNALQNETDKDTVHRKVTQMNGFGDFVRWATSRPTLQVNFVTDRDGNQIVDFIGRFENLEADFAEVCRRIGVEASLPHAFRSEHQAYRGYYDAEARRLVEEHLRPDIERFGYSF